MPQAPSSKRKGWGSSSHGFIFTNNLVVSGDDEIKVKLSDGREFKGQVKGPVDLDGPGAHQD